MCNTTTTGFRWGGGGDGLLVRASAVRRSRGASNWPRGRFGPDRARANFRAVREVSLGEIRGKTIPTTARKAPDVDFFTRIAVGLALDKPAYSSVSLI